jgi:hypothetical protein
MTIPTATQNEPRLCGHCSRELPAEQAGFCDALCSSYARASAERRAQKAARARRESIREVFRARRAPGLNQTMR